MEAKAKLEEEIQRSCCEADALKRKADEYSKDLQDLLLKVFNKISDTSCVHVGLFYMF